MAKMKTSSEREKWSRIEKLPAEWNAVNLRDILPMVFRFYLVHFVYTKRASAEIGRRTVWKKRHHSKKIAKRTFFQARGAEAVFYKLAEISEAQFPQAAWGLRLQRDRRSIRAHPKIAIATVTEYWDVCWSRRPGLKSVGQLRAMDGGVMDDIVDIGPCVDANATVLEFWHPIVCNIYILREGV